MAYAAAKDIGNEIPVIDMAPLVDGTPAQIGRVADEIRSAAVDIGFFYVRNHGVPQHLYDAALSAAKAFFDLPPELKSQLGISKRHRGFVAIGGANVAQGKRIDAKETFSWGLELPEDDPDVIEINGLPGPNNWPSFFPQLQPALYDYFLASFECGDRLLRAIAVSLGIDPEFFAKRYRKPFARGQIIHYPPQSPTAGVEQFGIGEHTDFGAITLLWQDMNGGLQVKSRTGDWVHATPIEGTMVINIGDLLERWSNDRFKSNPHRVVNKSGRDRYSLTVFYDPDYPTVVDPRDMGLPPGMAPKYEPVGAGDHIRARFDKTFSYRQK